MGKERAYVRPVVAEQHFTDADGQVIDYGNRWRFTGPPDDAYSVVTNPERFAPLHAIADALVAHLVDTYDVTIEDGLDDTRLQDWGRPTLRAVRLIPADPQAASMLIAWTDYPGVVVHAGLLLQSSWPVCGCDACDDSWERLADEIEHTVLAVATGGFTERIGSRWRPMRHWSLRDGDWFTGSGHVVRNVEPSRLKAYRKQLDALDDPWHPWPLATAR